MDTYVYICIKVVQIKRMKPFIQIRWMKSFLDVTEECLYNIGISCFVVNLYSQESIRNILQFLTINSVHLFVDSIIILPLTK